jgi:hypothetical protein
LNMKALNNLTYATMITRFITFCCALIPGSGSNC